MDPQKMIEEQNFGSSIVDALSVNELKHIDNLTKCHVPP